MDRIRGLRNRRRQEALANYFGLLDDPNAQVPQNPPIQTKAKESAILALNIAALLAIVHWITGWHGLTNAIPALFVAAWFAASAGVWAWAWWTVR